MTVRSRTKKALAMLLPAGVLGISAVLSTLRMEASTTIRTEQRQSSNVAERLREIRTAVSGVDIKEGENPDPGVTLLAEWPNFHFGWGNGGWHNGGWGNGGWHNGGWHNGGWGWHNGWGNGWHNGWGNGGWNNWHNFWHNW
jgi:rSAM-associated Gly-rich repeat protein